MSLVWPQLACTNPLRTYWRAQRVKQKVDETDVVRIGHWSNPEEMFVSLNYFHKIYLSGNDDQARSRAYDTAYASPWTCIITGSLLVLTSAEKKNFTLALPWCAHQWIPAKSGSPTVYKSEERSRKRKSRKLWASQNFEILGGFRFSQIPSRRSKTKRMIKYKIFWGLLDPSKNRLDKKFSVSASQNNRKLCVWEEQI